MLGDTARVALAACGRQSLSEYVNGQGIRPAEGRAVGARKVLRLALAVMSPNMRCSRPCWGFADEGMLLEKGA
jgi:hypothetical protein